MSNRNLRGLAWGHRRATGPLEPLTRAFQRQAPDVAIEWTIRPLSDFERQPIEAIADRYDLMIIDHPFCGDIASRGACLALENAVPELGPDKDRCYVGPSLASYRYDGHVWAAPIDAATPHAAHRSDLLAKVEASPPASWPEAIRLGERLRRHGLWLATPVASPHSFATVASLMANLGRPIAENLSLDPAAMAQALDALDAIVALSPPEALGWNAIGLSEAMVARDDIAFTPCVYGYATYAESDMRAPLSFSNFCGLAAPFEAGSMLGGTGLAASAWSKAPDAALAFIRFCLSAEAQVRIIPEHHGQPGLAGAWADSANDARFGGFFSKVRASMESAWLRPRRPKYILFQSAAGDLIASYCQRQRSQKETIEAVQRTAKTIFAG